jgi:predicted amidohydrolase/alkylhydroperoxidase/carboxymuconolactone decarboxylase family protein YurZ
VRVAVAQVEARELDLSGSIADTTAAIARAAGAGADLVVLPECVTTGWVVDREGVEALAEAGDGAGPALGAWRAAARQHGIAVIGGYAERDGADLFNSVAVIGRDGELQGSYRKLHLFGDEREVFAQGNLGLPVFELDGLRVGVLVCYDLRFPEAMRLLALEGVHLVAVPTAWVAGFDASTPLDEDSRIGQVDGALVQANLNQVYVACADLTGRARDLRFLGRSVIASPYGQPLAGPLPASGAGLLVAELDRAEAERAVQRSNGVSPRRDRRTDVYELARPEASPLDGARMLAEIERKRGYVLDLHRTLADRDPAFLAQYERFLGAAFLEERSLDRRVKELVYVGVLTALSTPQAHLVAHMQAAVAHGATPQEVLETLQLVLPPVGVPRFLEAMAAFEAAFAEERVATGSAEA